MNLRHWIATHGRGRALWGASLGMLLVSGLALFALYAMFRSGGESLDLQALLARISPQVLLLTSLTYALAMLLSVIGWGWMMGSLGGVWSWGEHAKIYCITTFTRRLPGAIWYMLGRVVLYERIGVKKGLTLLVGGLELGILIASGMLLALVTWPFLMRQTQSPLWFVAGLIGCAALLNPPVLRALIRRISRQHAAANISYRLLLGWLLLYTVIWCGNGIILYLLADAVHPLGGGELPAVLGIAAATGVIAFVFSFVPFGLGVQELTISVLLSPLIGGPEAVVVALLIRGILTLNEFGWALLGTVFGLGSLLRPRTLDREQALSDAVIPKEVAPISLVPPEK
ncbi:MAG: flippase-like domain-containing protein [Roseiflexaceae bacterium]|nr:flippase-like domain-containing protein [Roseiflexaceae bacterium]